MRLVPRLCLPLAFLPLVAATQEPPNVSTRAETSNYEETSSYADVIRIVNGLAAATPLAKQETFGTTEEGRAMPLLILSEPSVSTPDAARRLNRPIVFVMANIHAGEVEGKEASLILARRLTSGDLRPLLKQLVVLMAPIYNADGNEKMSVQNRTSQNGPIAGVGTRENSKGLDLNRDFMKLDSSEARALVGLMNRWDPHVTIDLHTTNGSYHGYHLTYAPTLNPNADARMIEFARDRILAAVREAVLKRHNFRTYYYGNFGSESGGARESSRVDPANPGDAIWRTFDHRPRFGNNYVGLRNRMAILSESYSYLDFQGRVKVTEAFVQECLQTIAANAARLIALTTQLDGELSGVSPTARRNAKPVKGAKPAPRAPLQLGVEFRMAPLPEPVDILIGNVEKRANPKSGREMLVMSDKAVPVKMKEYGRFIPVRTVSLPQGWLIPRPHVESGRYATAIERLRQHGIIVQRVAADAQMKVERFLIADFTRAERPFQGHNEARLKGHYETAMLSAQQGALFIPATQSLGRLAFYLLEPESDDGLVTWNYIEDGLKTGDTYPLYRVMDAGSLQFESDPR